MRIGLIAISGVRACDERLLRLGLTLPGFVERGKVIASLPSLGLLTLAGMTPGRHECVYLEIADAGRPDRLPVGFDLAAISSYSAQIGEASDVLVEPGAVHPQGDGERLCRIVDERPDLVE